MADPKVRDDKKHKKLEQELEGQGPEMEHRMRRAKTYQDELQHYTVWANERIAQGLSANSRHMPRTFPEHPLVPALRTHPRLSQPPHPFGVQNHAKPPLDPYRRPVYNPNEIYYVSPGGGFKLTLGQLMDIGRMMSDEDWIMALSGWSPMQHAHSMGMTGGEANSVEQLIEWLNKNTRLDLPDYTAACFDMYFAGVGIREGVLTLGVSPSNQTPIYKPYPLEYWAEGRAYSRDMVGRYQTQKFKRSLDDLESLRGAEVGEIESIIPKNWKASPLKKGEGMRYLNPNKKGESISIEKGWPDGTTPLHRGPYLKVSRNGKISRIPLAENPVLK